MTSHRKASPLPQIKPGDIISLPDLQTGTLALVMMDDYRAGEFKGIYYLPIHAMPRKSYRGQNVEGEQYHLSAKDHEEIRKSTKHGEYRLGDKSIYRLNYEITHTDFNEEKLPEVFFIKYASAGGTKFFQQAMRQFNQILLKKEGVVDDIKEVAIKPLPRLQAPSQREMARPSGAMVKDISLRDAVDPAFVEGSPYISDVTFATLSGIGNRKLRPETLKQAFEIVNLIETDEKVRTAFMHSFEKHARGKDWTRAEMYEDIKAGWRAFNEQILDGQYDFSSIKTDYTARKNG
jgi:hypothetical protein